MNLNVVMEKLEALGNERMKKRYLSNGAHEPLYGVATGAMKPLKREIKINQPLAEELYATGNYDAMYFAGVIADPKAMTKSDFNRWIDEAYFYMISDFVVAVTLSESPIGQEVADEWIESGDELKMSAGWSAYCWMLGHLKNEHFDEKKISKLLDKAESLINTSPDRAKSSMSNFVSTVAISYEPMREKAITTADEIGIIKIERRDKKPGMLNPSETIKKADDRGQHGFKRRYVRC
ncbi:DNA alkylation repair protein [Macrococcus lamae]|uniref:DNA alkylation repair protein n=1 Tax=Macrococcus lamae TaxID=198484 RepID=A0A4R6BXI0_9STAP|nr:DNA alkylation repair protein [Macrococcus lamae]TDM12718.1 DNA alkylation repair protein [Macrococcus lamae]